MSFKPPAYEHRAYYVFHKASGRIAYSHRFLTIAGDDSVLKRFNEQSMLREAAKHAGCPETELEILTETGVPQGGRIAGVDIQSKKLIRAASLQRGATQPK
jgi:hypothetical protein